MTETSRPIPTAVILILICGAFVILGSVGPWRTIGPVGESGMDRNGVYTMVLGASVVVLSAVSLRAWSVLRAAGAIVLCVVCGAIGAYDWMDVAGREEGFFRPQVDPGWGVIVTTVAGFAGVVPALWSIPRRNAPVVAEATGEIF